MHDAILFITRISGPYGPQILAPAGRFLASPTYLFASLTESTNPVCPPTLFVTFSPICPPPYSLSPLKCDDTQTD